MRRVVRVSSKAAASVKSLRRPLVLGAVILGAVLATGGAAMPDGRPTPTVAANPPKKALIPLSWLAIADR